MIYSSNDNNIEHNVRIKCSIIISPFLLFQSLIFEIIIKVCTAILKPIIRSFDYF